MAVFDRLGLDPVRPDRDRRPEPRPRAARPGRRLPPRVDRRAPVRGARACSRPTTRACRSCRPPSCRGTGSAGIGRASATRAARSTSTRRSSRSCSTRIRTSGPMSSIDVEPRAAIDWYWRPDEPGPGDPRGARRGRHPRPRPARRQPPRLRPVERLFPAELLARAASRRANSSATSCCRATAAHGLLGTIGQRGAVARDVAAASTLGVEDGLPLGAAAGASCHAELVEAGDAAAGRDRRRSRASRFIVAGEALAARQARGARWLPGLRPAARSPGVAFLGAARPARLGPRLPARRCYDFDYIWEVYVPAPKRRWGYYVLPILFGDRLVGRIEPRIERKAGRAPDPGRVVGGRLRPARGRGVRRRASPRRSRRIERSAGSKRVAWPRTARLRAFVDAVSGRAGRRAPSARSGRGRTAERSAPGRATSAEVDDRTVDQAPQLPALSRAPIRNS